MRKVRRLQAVCLVVFTSALLTPLLGCSSGSGGEPAVAQSGEPAVDDQTAAPASEAAAGESFAQDDLAPTASDLSSSADQEPKQTSPVPAPRAATKPISQQVPQEVVDAPVTKIVQKYDDSDQSHRVFEAKRLPQGVLMHGRYIEYRRDGSKLKAGMHEYSQKVGEWTYWSRDGVVMKKGTYEANYLHGEWHKFRSDGTLQWIEEYDRGQKSGTWASFGEDGESKVWERGFLNGEPHGVWTQYHENGRKKIEQHYRDGRLHGSEKAWYAGGQLQHEGSYEEGERHGAFRKYGEDGNIRDQTEWVHGSPKIN